MAKPGRQKQETSASEIQSSRGGRQAIVELCEISSCGLVFWSRQRFEIGAVMQVRIQRSAIPSAPHAAASSKVKWVMLSGVVVACPPLRREDGSAGFQVSLLVENTDGKPMQVSKIGSGMRWFKPALPGLRRFGLN